MNIALQKTLEILLIILLGILLQKKVAKNDLKGIKTLILTVALPATIFVALLKVELDKSLLVFPLVALVFNFIMVFATKYLSNASLSNTDGAKKRTLMMLLPSLAPGLSCFPFIMAYLGDDYIALAALADVGNKVFVLILLYLFAMHLYQLRSISNEKKSTKNRVKSLLISMFNEPINLVMIGAFVLLAFGLNLTSMPGFLQNTITKMSVIMTPLVLLFIGMAVRINLKEFSLIFFLLTQRAGITFCLSAMVIFLFPYLAPAMILFIIVFPQSACSFWPFAHMSAINTLEDSDKQPSKTFDIDFAVNVLACSLPFSTLLIISIFSFSDVFINPITLLIFGISMVGISFAPYILRKVKESKHSVNSKNIL